MVGGEATGGYAPCARMQPIRKAWRRVRRVRAVSARFGRRFERCSGGGLRRAPESRPELRRENEGETDESKPEMRALGKHGTARRSIAGVEYSGVGTELKHSVCRASNRSIVRPRPRDPASSRA